MVVPIENDSRISFVCWWLTVLMENEIMLIINIENDSQISCMLVANYSSGE